MRAITLISTTLWAVTGCSGPTVVNTDEPRPTDPADTVATPELPPVNNTHLANAFDYVAHPNDQAAYYFTTPSGRWQCAILPRVMAGCQSARGALGIADAPDTVPDGAGGEATPNAIVIEPAGDSHFAVLDQPGFTMVGGPANDLPFNRTLIVARFRCNVQEETGVSCLSEESGKGFTFSADGYLPQYTEVPVDAP
ncbi:hypothetical protein [Mycolicibacterium stellerae]|uniref:hypothetical protein n=1 Tax=Mycolicibacterium stellerae TaxID=2358193 RepID=UPI000F0B0A5B|nr:hypothetical protein [Mycolicibacterium stellerae]